MNKAFRSAIPYFIITGVSLGIIIFIFGDAFWHPNSYTFMTGGDGNVIYYNMIYHTLYGHGLFLENMNYTDPECIFMTDAQASISILLSKLKYLFPRISSYVIGAAHVLMMLGICLQYILLYKIIRKIGGRTWLSIIFAIGIGTLAPQLVRIRYGHLGLAYPFIIPAAIYWLLTFQERSYWDWRNLGFCALILFFGFNNPYLLVITSAFLVAYGVTNFLWNYSPSRNYFPFILGILFLLILYSVTHILDPYPDRIKNQWGSYYFSSTIEDLLWGRYSLSNTILDYMGINYEGRSESRATLAFSSIIILIIASIYAIINRRKIKFPPTPISLMGISCIPIFIYASSLFKSKWWLYLTEDLGFISMVKATGRFSWIIYYVPSIMAVSIIIKLQNSELPKRQFLIALIGIMWMAEGYLYIKDHVKPQLFNNQYSDLALADYISPKSASIDFNRFQAILTIPVIQTWNDNLMDSGDWATDIHAFTISLATGLPLLSSKISRSPVGRSLENLQLGADPILRRTLLNRLNPDQPLLLTKTCNINNLTPGEQWMLDQASIIYQDESIDIFELWPKQLNNENYTQQLISQCGQQKAWYYYENFDGKSAQGKINNGYMIGTDWAAIDTIHIPDGVSASYELSIWSKVNIEKYGMPQFEIWSFDNMGSQLSYQYIDARDFIDNQDGWLKMSKDLYVQSNQKIILKARGRYPMVVDELLFRPLNRSPTCIHDNGLTFINNIRVDEL